MSDENPRTSGVVICFNEEETIERCLESLSWCDEIVVVDSHSTDRTREIAARHAERVVQQDFLGYVKQKNFALDLARGEWAICLDADEALSPELQGEIRGAIEAGGSGADGFALDRCTRFLGVWHDRGDWYPDWQLRVFRRSRGRWTGRDPHDRVQVDGTVRRLRGRLFHWNYRDLSEHIQTIDGFTAHLAREMRDEGLRFRLRDLLVRPAYRFFRGYVLRQGFRKGLPGLLVAVSTSYYVFMKYAKLWELEQRQRK